MTTPPFISEVVEEFDDLMHTGYHKDIKVWLSQKLTAVYERGREDVIDKAKSLVTSAMIEICDHGASPSFELCKVLSALTTEGE